MRFRTQGSNGEWTCTIGIRDMNPTLYYLSYSAVFLTKPNPRQGSGVKLGISAPTTSRSSHVPVFHN